MLTQCIFTFFEKVTQNRQNSCTRETYPYGQVSPGQNCTFLLASYMKTGGSLWPNLIIQDTFFNCSWEILSCKLRKHKTTQTTNKCKNWPRKSGYATASFQSFTKQNHKKQHSVSTPSTVHSREKLHKTLLDFQKYNSPSGTFRACGGYSSKQS